MKRPDAEVEEINFHAAEIQKNLATSDWLVKNFKPHLGSLSRLLDFEDLNEICTTLTTKILKEGRANLSSAALSTLIVTYRFQFKFEEIFQCVEELPDDIALEAAALRTTSFALGKLGRHQKALEFSRKQAALRPDSPVAAHNYFTNLKSTGRKADAVKQFQHMRKTFGASRLLSLFLNTKTRELDDYEMRFILNQIKNVNDDKIRKLVPLLQNSIISSQQEKMMRETLRSISPEQALIFQPILSQAADKNYLAQTNIEASDFAICEERRDQVYTNTTEQLRLEIQKSPSFARALDKLSDRHQTAVVTQESVADAACFARYLSDKIAQAQPFHFTRLGDGEGSFMRPFRANATHPHFDTHASNGIQKIWWNKQADPETSRDLAAGYHRALQEADALGMAPVWRLLQAVPEGAQHKAQESLLYTFELVADRAAGADCFITSAHAHSDLEAWDLWRFVFNQIDNISFISCHDMEAALHARFQLKTNTKIITPAEADFSEQFGLQSDETLLDRYEDVLEQINPRQGEVWLVAAGFLGKLFGAKIKELGGIALDIGSLADYWMGHETRIYSGASTGHHLHHSLAKGHGLPWKDRSVAKLKPNETYRSTHRFDGLITLNVPPLVEPLAPKKFKVIGHPRCGSGFVAQFLKSKGYEIGHEKIAEDGISSWMQTVADLHVPWGETPHPKQEFDWTIGHIRDPLSAIPSIMLENGEPNSFGFRRTHILHKLDVDIASYQTPLERAVASYVYWYKLVEAEASDGVLRIEDAEPEFSLIIGKTPISRRQLGEDVLPRAKYNSTQAKYGLAKPIVAPSAYLAIDNKLLTELRNLCETYYYRPI